MNVFECILPLYESLSRGTFILVAETVVRRRANRIIRWQKYDNSFILGNVLLNFDRSLSLGSFAIHLCNKRIFKFKIIVALYFHKL